MTTNSQYFSDNYAQTRKKFKQACDAINVDMTSFKNPAKGPEGEELFVDSCWIGSKDAAHIMILISGTHGVEGFAGSACQIGWMHSLKDNPLPEDMAVLVIHMINPFGCAWLCVETEENIDLNRNFVNYNQPLPVNRFYGQLHDAFTCQEYEGPVREQAEEKKQQFIENNGFDAFLEAAAMGQYLYQDGFNFGGQQPAWSNEILNHLLKLYCSNVKSVAVIDYHTGLGEYGDAMLISTVAGTDAAKKLQSWYGDIHFSSSGDIGYETTGGLADSIEQSLKDVDVMSIVVEYGTFDIDRIASAMFNSFWLTQFGDYSTERAKDIQLEMKKCFYPNEVEWHKKTFQRSQQIINQAITGLRG